MTTTWQNLIGSPEAPYDISLAIKDGDTLAGRGHYPDLEVVAANSKTIKELKWQFLRVKASQPGEDRKESFVLGRMVGIFEGSVDEEDQEIEIGERVCLPVELVDDQVDTSKCGACGKKIPKDMAEIHKDEHGNNIAYHLYCYDNEA